MANLNIPVGISDFEKIRKNGFYYVDKSSLIAEILKDEPTEVTLITRPRRFGKTLGMSMLRSFFDIRKDSKELFEGLEISEDASLCREWMNQWPTIFFTLKDIDGLDFDEAYGQLAAQISNLFKEYTYLLDSEDVDIDDKEIFLALKAGKADKIQISRSLNTLMRMLQQYYKKPVILLLDEYDVPIAKASSHGYYAQMLNLIKIMMSTAFKDNNSLRFAVITGCLKIAKESIFTGTNNLVSDTITDSRLNECFGFTQKEVDKLLIAADAQRLADKIKEWYDGYQFGDFDVYCPWDVMNYLYDLKRNPMAKPASYWRNTSDNAIIRSFIEYAGNSITKKLEILLSGGYILQQIDENLTYDYLHSSEDNLWSVLYVTGYLTKIRNVELEKSLPENMLALQIPNAEIREIFETTVVKWFDDSAKTWNRRELFAAVWAENSENLTEEMNKLLRKTISYHDYREDFYHAFLAGIFAGAGYIVESNKEHGEGRSDVVVYDSVNSRVAVFEAKYAVSMDEMGQKCDEALHQIDERMYAKEFEDEYDHILCYGISFFKKRCLIRIK
ncbi:AAA family ATPase [Blautia sp. MSJ-19]|uniref:AAA family ATPase n=1 Tax=Blautia sp. MSJ-19 TaxID=2841517 RepID=UPI001C0EA275|nr:AAA family ATPase [Blautia sp. MSJ-19]MBU5480639.1 ATP-binding protein [Blautia sp. MSJ-19]